MAERACAKNIANERAARIKATRQRVFISGLKDDHTLETGVAYHYRGHFIYAYPAGNPIEPVPFSTKKGINIVGTVQDQAPIYDYKEPKLVYENTIAALQRSCVHEWEFQEEQEEIKKQETKKALEEEEAGEKEKKEKKNEGETEAGNAKEIDAAATPKARAQEPLPSQAPARVPSFTTLLVPSQVSSNIGSRTGSHQSLHHPSSSSTALPRIGTVEAPPTTINLNSQPFPSTSYTPHDRGHYLAYSAPGSRHASVDNTPFVSRPVSPTHGPGLSVRGSGQGHGSPLRPIASTSRLNQLLAEEGFRRSLSPLVDVAGDRLQGGAPHWEEENMVANLSAPQGWIHSDALPTFVEAVSRYPSRSRPSSRSRALSRVNSRSPQADSLDNEDMEGALYLHGLGHPDVIRDDASRAQTRESSPFRAPSHQSAETAVYLRGLAQRHYYAVNTGSRSPSLAREEGSRYPESDIQSGTFSSRPQIPIGLAPVGSRGGPGLVTPLHHDTTPAFTFPAPRSPETSSFPTFVDPVPSGNYIVHTDKKPLNTGRPRAASKALNEAYNAANPSSTHRPVYPLVKSNEYTENIVFTARCPIHSESCSGQDVVHKHLTERARNGAGFKDLFPTIQCEDGRVMVDWAKMRDEEMGKLKKL